MDLTNIKLIVSDMDGTLLNSKHELSNKFLELFEELKKYNIHFCAASGRPHYSMISKFESILPHITIIAENGGIITKDFQLLAKSNIEDCHRKALFEAIQPIEDVNPIYCTQNKAYIQSDNPEVLSYVSEYYTNYKIVNSINEVDEAIIKIALYHPIDSEVHIYPFVKNLETDFLVKVSGKHWVDISDKKTNKGNAIKLLQNQLNITKEETMAFGDYFNDIEMLNSASFSFAMENAHPAIKEISNYCTKSNDDFGVEIIIEKLIKQLS